MAGRTFKLHEATQRAFSRLAYLLLGFLPLALCACWSVYSLFPSYSRWQAAAWESQLSKTYGLTVRVAKAHALAPHRFRLEGLEFYHPESHRLVGSVNEVQVRAGGGWWNVYLSEARLKVDQLADASRVFNQWYVCRPMAERHRAVVQIDRMVVEGAIESLDLSNLDIKLFPEATKWELQANFDVVQGEYKTVDRDPQTRNQLIVVRHHDSDALTTDAQLRTASPLPLWLLALEPESAGLPSMSDATRNWIASSQFTGLLDIRYNGKGTNWFMKDAKLTHLDMGQFGISANRAVSGQGTLYVKQAMLNANGLQSAEGLFEMGPGRMESSLFQSMSFHLNLEIPRQNQTKMIAFDRLATHFRVQPDSLQLVGGLNDGHLLVDSQGALATRRDLSAMPIVNLVRALAELPGGAHSVRQALVWLPIQEAQRREAYGLLRMSNNPGETYR